VICEPWDVVIVPFPFTERPGIKRRPALVISKKRFNNEGHTLLAMITTQDHPSWPGDTKIGDRQDAGLPASCLVRLKIFTLDNRLILKTIGRLSAADRQEVDEKFHQYLV